MKNKEYYELVQKAKELISLNSSADQVIVVETVKTNRYYFINSLPVEVDKTSQYYDSMHIEKCDCGYCVNYYKQIKKEYPLLDRYLTSLGVDIEKPHETSPIEIHEKGYIEYYPQYVVIGTKPREFSAKVGDVTITIAKSYPGTNVEEEHFVLDVCPVRLKWQN